MFSLVFYRVQKCLNFWRKLEFFMDFDAGEGFKKIYNFIPFFVLRKCLETRSQWKSDGTRTQDGSSYIEQMDFLSYLGLNK